MKKIIMIIMLVALLLLAVPLPVSAAVGVTAVSKTGDGVWMGNIWQINLYPSETKSTTIELYNSSNSSLNTDVSIIPDSLDNGNLTFELNKSSFVIVGKSYTNVTLTVRANGSVTPGTYTSELRIETVSLSSVTTNAAWPVIWRLAILRGSLDSLSTAKIVSVYFEWGETVNYGSTTRVQTIRQPRSFVAMIAGLTPATTYHFRAVVVVGDDIIYGDDVSFTTREIRTMKIFRIDS